MTTFTSIHVAISLVGILSVTFIALGIVATIRFRAEAVSDSSPGKEAISTKPIQT
jgi:hypothetical protein